MINKIYMSRAQTRAMAIEHPIGDPTGGPAYGEKNDPISAALAIGSMGATYAAAGTFAAMTVLQGITFAGAALSLVGNVTGNKSLMKLGMVANLAGGIGALAEGAGLFGPEGSGNLGEKLGITSSVSDEALRAGSSTLAPGTQAPVLNGAQTGPVVDAASAPSAVNNRSLNVNTPGGATPSLNAPNPGTDILGRQLPSMSYAPGMGPNMSPAVPAGPGFVDSMKAGNYMDAAKAAGSGAMDALKNNPTGAYVAAQAVGAVANVLSGKTGAELEALKANTGYANAKALEVQESIAKEQRRRANLANGYANVKMGNMAVNTGTSMTANPAGLITGARG